MGEVQNYQKLWGLFIVFLICVAMKNGNGNENENIQILKSENNVTQNTMLNHFSVICHT